MLIPINLTGPTAKNRALFTSNQKTVNFYPEKQGNEFVLHGTPGLKAFYTGNAPCRGAIEHKGLVYQVQGNTLYSISSAAAETSLGTIGGSTKCVLTALGDTVIVVVEGNVYEWDEDSDTFTTASDVDFESPTSCAFINNQIVYNGTDNRWCVSDVGDGISIDSLNYATAESDATNIVRMFSYDRLVYIFKGNATEIWWNTGDLDNPPPFDRLQEVVPVGLAGIHAVGSNDNGIYFLGDDKNIYFMKGTSYQAISTNAIANEIGAMTTIVDCEVNAFTSNGHNFVLFTFPNANRTFVFDDTIGVDFGWFEMSSNEASTERYLASSILTAFNKILVTDANNGNIYELDPDTYTEAGDSIIRIRDTLPFHGGLVGAPGKRIVFNRFELYVETGVGVGSDPNIILQYSDDGGRTWSTEAWGTLGIGAAGDYIKTIQWLGLGFSLTRTFRIKGSDAVFYSIRGASIDIEVGL